MKEIEYRKVQVMKYEQTIERIVCDECNIEINKASGFDEFYEVHTWSEGIGDVTGGEDFDLCSIKCLTSHMNYYYKEEMGSEYSVKSVSVSL